MRRTARVGLLLLAVGLFGAWWLWGRGSESVRHPAASSEPPLQPSHDEALVPASAVPAATSLTSTDNADKEDTPRTTLPTPGTRARRRTWVNSSYGPGERQLGYAKFDNEMTPPQGFVVTPDGKLLVLDTIKQRLVWYSAEGEFERAVPLPGGAQVFPADVSIAADGTIVVVDHAGVQTKGVVMLDAQGNKVRELPQVQDGLMMGFYTVHNDIYGELGGEQSIKLGDTSGSASDETPDLYQQDNGTVPGLIAPDGRTVISVAIDDKAAGTFAVTVTRGPQPEHVFTRFYSAGRDATVYYAQLDAAGRIYLVLAFTDSEALLCLDGAGEPVGLAPMPQVTSSEGGTQFRRYRVVPTGGLVATVNTMQGVSYEWFNCF